MGAQKGQGPAPGTRQKGASAPHYFLMHSYTEDNGVEANKFRGAAHLLQPHLPFSSSTSEEWSGVLVLEITCIPRHFPHCIEAEGLFYFGFLHLDCSTEEDS